MFFPRFFGDRARQELRQLNDFDWQQLLRPASAGRWPLLVRGLVFVLYALLAAGLVLLVYVLFVPRIGVDESVELNTLQEKIAAQQASNFLAAARQLEAERRCFFSCVLLQQDSSELPDITETMAVVRAASADSGVQLLSVVPDVPADNGQARVMLKARLMLSSLSVFWLQLSANVTDFSIDQMALERAEKPGFFELTLELWVPVVEQMLPSARSLTPFVLHTVTDSAPPQQKTAKKGFLLRAGNAEFLYLVRDEKGRLQRVEEPLAEN